jgi:hypothetical protein
MKTKAILAALALGTAVTAIPATAQTTDRYDRSDRYDRNDRGDRAEARDSFQEQIAFFERRLNRGIADRTITRREERQLRYELSILRRDAEALDRRFDDFRRRLRIERGDDDYRRYAIDYDAARYYRDDPRYRDRERYLGPNDAIYRGSDGRYYCQRSDGTIGLVVGGVGGAALGNVIDGGSNRIAGTLIGGALGALLGQQIDRSNSDVRCR